MSEKSQLHQAVELCLYLGIDLEYGKLNLCNLAHFSITRNALERKYQVDCDNANCRFSEIYSNPKVAADKYILLFNTIRSKELKY